MQTPIEATPEHIEQILKNHLRPYSIKVPPVIERGKQKVSFLWIFKFTKPYDRLIPSPDREVSRISSYKYIHNEEDDIGFVTLTTTTYTRVEYQMRGITPCFASFTKLPSIANFGLGSAPNIRYDVNYPTGELATILQHWGERAKKDFFTNIWEEKTV